MSERPYSALSQDSIGRLIWRDHDPVAFDEWQSRYGHAFPVFCVLGDKEYKFQSDAYESALLRAAAKDAARLEASKLAAIASGMAEASPENVAR